MAIEINGAEAAYWAGRAEANLLRNDAAAARRDFDQARRLDPARDWSDLEKRLPR